MNIRLRIILVITSIIALSLFIFINYRNSKTRKTVTSRIAEFGTQVEQRLKPDFDKAGIQYPPDKLAFIAIKDKKILQAYAANASRAFKHIRSYPILAASGKLGPKLKEGDKQVPEGIYKVESLNPNSRFHLAIRVNYPNEFDQAKAAGDGRTNIGTDIMIHGKNASIGCLAMGDETAEDLFILTALAKPENVTLLFTPIDFRTANLTTEITSPVWVSELHKQIKTAIQAYPAP